MKNIKELEKILDSHSLEWLESLRYSQKVVADEVYSLGKILLNNSIIYKWNKFDRSISYKFIGNHLKSDHRGWFGRITSNPENNSYYQFILNDAELALRDRRIFIRVHTDIFDNNVKSFARITFPLSLNDGDCYFMVVIKEVEEHIVQQVSEVVFEKNFYLFRTYGVHITMEKYSLDNKYYRIINIDDYSDTQNELHNNNLITLVPILSKSKSLIIPSGIALNKNHIEKIKKSEISNPIPRLFLNYE